MVRYKIRLTKEEVDVLKSIINKGLHTSHTFSVAYILLNCDDGEYSDKVVNEQISKVLRVSMRTIDRVKKRFVEEGLESALRRKKGPRVYDIKLDGDVEAKLVQLCCSRPPAGYSRWSLRLLADKMVELNYVESISHVSVGSILKKTNLSLGKWRDG
jgi:transposase